MADGVVRPGSAGLILVREEWELIVWCMTYPEDVWNAGDDTHAAIRKLLDKLRGVLPGEWNLDG